MFLTAPKPGPTEMQSFFHVLLFSCFELLRISFPESFKSPNPPPHPPNPNFVMLQNGRDRNLIFGFFVVVMWSDARKVKPKIEKTSKIKNGMQGSSRRENWSILNLTTSSIRLRGQKRLRTTFFKNGVLRFSTPTVEKKKSLFQPLNKNHQIDFSLDI